MHKKYNQLIVMPVRQQCIPIPGSGEDTGGLGNLRLFYDEWQKNGIKIKSLFWPAVDYRLR
jgi:hypothetical protein